ncbi:hypothetical protein EO94_01060 [Methanosarcina sp. 2.H.T.1A.3]|nr:hypothetical protein EO94_01060 [Methanosarcina sp. 2.H.T.1A.3]
MNVSNLHNVTSRIMSFFLPPFSFLFLPFFAGPPDKLAEASDIYLWVENGLRGSRELFAGVGDIVDFSFF